MGRALASANETSPATEWPTFDVAGLDAFGLSDFPFVDSRTPAWFPNLPGPESGSYPQAFHHSRPAAGPAQNSRNTSVGGLSPGDENVEEEVAFHCPPTTSGSKRFLQTFYRMSQPGRVSGLADEDFVNYYFNSVCTVYSCFDSPHNKFRSLVADAWTNSATIYLAIQSMAAGHLANHYPSLAPLGVQKRTQSWKYLQKDLQLYHVGKVSAETVLLSLLLLGPSSCWHQVSHLGMQFLFIARNLMQAHLRDGRAAPSGMQNEEFFHEALLRWEMLASFVDPVPFAALAGSMELPEQQPRNSRDRVMPHPWTGVAPEIHFALAEVGRMLRRRRTHAAQIPGTPQTNGSAYISATDDQWVEALEDFLYTAELPAPEQIANYEDVRTPNIDLIVAGDAMRLAGLLEIYDTFPELLRQRSQADADLCGFSFASVIEDGARGDGLAALATYILDTVKPIAITSAACRFLPLVLLMAGSRLSVGSSDQEQDEIIDLRYVVEARMLLLSRKYPQKPMLQMLDIIKEVWQRLDQGSTEAHWLDVADEKGWQTLIG